VLPYLTSYSAGWWRQ